MRWARAEERGIPLVNSTKDSRHKRPGRPFMICFIGPSGAGKTTILEKLIRDFSKRGLRVGAIKHSRAAIPLDTKGKDSYRFRLAGARGVLVAGARMTGYFSGCNGRPLTPGGARRYFPGTDIILVEGWKNSSLPKIFVGGGLMPPRGIKHIIAQIAERGALTNVPRFNPSRIRPIADFILRISH